MLPGMHVGVEEIVAERLREEDLDAVLGQALDVRAAALQLRHVRDQHAAHALHHHHVLAAVVPVHLRHVQQVRALEVASELRSVRRLAQQVELIEDRLLVFAHQLDRPQPMRVAPVALREVRQRVQHFQVALDQRADAGTHDLDDDFLTVRQLRRMDLRDRRRGERLLFEAREHLGERPPISELGDAPRVCAGERRHAVLKFLQLIGDVARQQVATRREHLAELHEDRTELFQCQPDALAARGVAGAPEPGGGREIKREAQRAEQVRGANDAVQPVPHEHPLDLQQARQDARPHARLTLAAFFRAASGALRAGR